MILFVIFFILPANIVAEENKQGEDSILIETYTKDITGDGLDETIELKGKLFSPDSSFYQEIWIDITNDQGNEWTINYGNGYEPAIEFVDLNHDHIKDILYQSSTGGSGGLYHYDLHTFANEQSEEIPLPEQDYIKGRFQDQFQVNIELSPYTDPIIMDIRDRKKEYISLKIYDESGKLLQPTSLMVDPIAFYEPILISKNKGYGLKSYQQISGAYHADQLGTIETLWYFENGDWVIVQTEWIPSDTSM